MYSRSLGIDVGELITKGGPAVAAVGKVVKDPGLPEVTCHVLRLNRITEGKDPGPPCPRRRYTSVDRRRGIGLARATKLLRLAVWTREHPALATGIGASIVLSLVGIGYYLGRKR